MCDGCSFDSDCVDALYITSPSIDVFIPIDLLEINQWKEYKISEASEETHINYKIDTFCNLEKGLVEHSKKVSIEFMFK